MESFIVLISPFVLNGVVELFKWMAQRLSTGSKRGILAIFALIGAVAYSQLTGTPINMDSISSIWQVIADAGVAFILSHGTYTLFFNKK